MTRIDIATAIAAGINEFYRDPSAQMQPRLLALLPPECTAEMVVDVANWRMAGQIGVPPHGVLGACADSHIQERWPEYLEAAVAEGAPCGIVPPGPWEALSSSRVVVRRNKRGTTETVCVVNHQNPEDARAIAVFIAASREAAEALAGLLAIAESQIKRRRDGMPVDAHHRALDAELQPARRALAKLQGLEA